MKKTLALAGLVAVLSLLQSCSSHDEFDKNSQIYEIAKSLTLKYPALNPDSNFVLVKTNDFELRWSELFREMYRIDGQKAAQLRFQQPAQVRAEIRERAEIYALRKHLIQEAKKAGISVMESEINSRYLDQFAGRTSEEAFLQQLKDMNVEVEAVKEEIANSLLIEKYVEGKLASATAVDPAEVEMFYQQGKAATFRHILLSTNGKSDSTKSEVRQKMEDILARARRGEDFADLARKHSQDPGSKDKGGLYVDMRREQLEPTFAEAVFTLEIDKVSDIVETPFGYHIIKVLNRKQETQPLSEVRGEIAETIRAPRVQKAYAEYLVRVREEIGLKYVAPQG